MRLAAARLKHASAIEAMDSREKKLMGLKAYH
jgi:hypothetical protein